jgi:hypothetical protein
VCDRRKLVGAEIRDPERPSRQTLEIAPRSLRVAALLPGIKVNTSPTDHVPVDQMQFMRFNGRNWDRFGDLQTGN